MVESNRHKGLVVPSGNYKTIPAISNDNLFASTLGASACSGSSAMFARHKHTRYCQNFTSFPRIGHGGTSKNVTKRTPSS